MRLRHWALILPTGLVSLIGCGSAPALMDSADVGSGMVRAQAVVARPSIAVSRGTLSARKLGADGGPVLVGATVVLKNLTPGQVSVVAQCVDARKNILATRVMAAVEGNSWRTTDPGLAVPQNFSNRAVSHTIQVVATATATPSLRKALKAGTVTVAKSSSDPNLPPPPPGF